MELGTSAEEQFGNNFVGAEVFDVNVRVGRSGVHGALALEEPQLLAEMDRFGIHRAIVSHFASEEYDAEFGNRALEQVHSDRLVPVWAANTDPHVLPAVQNRHPKAVRLFFGVTHHNFSPADWCSGQLLDYLQEHSILTLISRDDLDWDGFAALLAQFPRLTVAYLDIGYRGDRYLFPLLQRYPRLHFDTSMYLAHRQLESFIERHGPERALFGSRLPLYTPGAALVVLATARISQQARSAVAGGNLERILSEVKS